jgi:hypothetical protein
MYNHVNLHLVLSNAKNVSLTADLLSPLELYELSSFVLNSVLSAYLMSLLYASNNVSSISILAEMTLNLLPFLYLGLDRTEA